jgi:ribosome biogenesis GTPase
VVGLVVAGIGVGVFLQMRSPPAAPSYVTSPLARGDLAATISATGALRGQDTVAVGAETSGRVSAVNADFNAIVHVNQVLVEIDPAQYQASLRQSEAQLLAARADVTSREASAIEARQAVARLRSMTTDGLSSRQSLEAAEAAARRADAAVAVARAQVAVAQADVSSRRTALEKTQIRSPLDGVVLSREVEPGQTLALVGSSGMGKSTLANRLCGYLRQETGGVREHDARGRHTTTRRELFALPGGALLLDTPGMRGLGLWDAEGGVAAVFDDVEALATRCRFGDCRHAGEPGCAVGLALASGELKPARLAEWAALRREAAFEARKADPAVFAEHRRVWKARTKAARQMRD